jgi:hypothetical protein
MKLLIILLAAAGLAGGSRAAAADPTYTVIGASVTRLAAVELRAAFGDSLHLEAADGRSFIHPDNRDAGGTIMDVFRARLAYQRPGDWVVIEMAHGGVPVDVNRRYLTEVVRLLPDSVCLAVVAPHTYYGLETAATRAWNSAMRQMQVEVLALQPCRHVIDWSLFVRRATASSTLSAELRALGQPLLYDGRHPTAAGARTYASALYWATR